jgi:hypothetical protein
VTYILRSPDTIITVAVMPVMLMLLFVFGGAIQTGTGDCVNYLLPGILLIAVASGSGSGNHWRMQWVILCRYHLQAATARLSF